MDMKPTQEQVIAWAREADDYANKIAPSESYEGQRHLADLRFAALAYEAGRKDENEACQEICNRHRETIAGVIHHAIRARREQ